MAEVVSVVAETLRNLLIEEAKFLSGVSSQVEEVQAELVRMQCFLKDADRRQQKEETIRNYVKEIRRLAYRIENVLTTYAVEVASRGEGSGILKVLKRFACGLDELIARHKVGSEIVNIKERIIKLTASMQTYGVRQIFSEEGQSSNAMSEENLQRLRQTYPHQVEEYFVGMADDMKQLLSLLTDEGIRSHRVVSIYGMGGLGKTTLARRVYNHIDVKRCFNAFAWVSITQQFHTRTVLRDIVKQLLPNQRESVMNMEVRELVSELYKVQKEIKCLIVLDDLWEIDDWKVLSPAFPFAEANSKILITTRNQNLAEAEFPYPLKFLSENEGWELLQKRAFARKDAKDLEIDSRFEVVGREIVRKCGKLPLAISVLGGILSKKDSSDEWQNVSKDVDLYLRRIEESKDGYGTTMQVLALSYDELPYHLKSCFLHLGHFKEDEDINAERLFLMWIAEGMISSTYRGKEETLMDVAERYLYELASRSMVQLELNLYSTTRRIRSCRLHDLMRDFCLAHGEEVEFLKVLDFQGGKEPSLDPSKGNICRFSIYMDYRGGVSLVDEAMKSVALESNGKVRSLQLRGNRAAKILCEPEKFNSVNFKLLRVLTLEGCDVKWRMLPEGMKKLICLRFLSLRHSRLDELPSSISQLEYLQTLDLRIFKYMEIKVPNVLWKLIQLRHLFLPSTRCTPEGKGKEKLRLHGLSKLETLVKFNSNYDDPKDLSELINLRMFRAKTFENKSLHEILDYISSAASQHKLRYTKLFINYYELRESAMEEKLVPVQEVFACPTVHHLTIIWGRCQLQKLDIQFPFHSNLTEVILRCEIEGDPMETLGKFSNLRKLTFENANLIDKQSMTCDAKSFPKLKYLEIYSLSELEKWMVLEGALANLSHLKISRCNNLEMLPDGLRFITSLKEIKIEVMPKTFTDRIVINGVDFYKICHVPLISVRDE